ncbi:hypothetical protein GH5_07980 [Leishmania sp. Ghana 2012 LV757]|uniref:hypothetical protein n=1 Tax=Leishmania sp. Ghana 2012 LV757 TaxID=2803181 RepID=UPI001B707C87|nr:hypothetical protein GH5_07980 [Leishmania sp. Ghana 2012 LV757]
MENDADSSITSTASVQFSLASSNFSDRGSGSCTMSPSSNSYGNIPACGGDVHRPMPSLRVPKPTRPMLRAAPRSSSPEPLGGRASVGSAPPPITSASSARAPHLTTPLQATLLPQLPNRAHRPRSPSSKEVRMAFMHAVQRLDSDDQRLSQSLCTDSGGHHDDSDPILDSVSAKQRRENAAVGDAIHRGKPTPPSRQLLVTPTSRPPQQCARMSDTMVATTSSSIHFALASSCERDEEVEIAAVVADAAPPSRAAAAEQAAPSPQQQQPAVGPVKAPPAGAALHLVHSPEKLAPKKLLMKVVTGVFSGSRGPQVTVHRIPPSTTAGATSALGTAGGGRAMRHTVSPTNPESFAFAHADPVHCAVSEMTMVNAMSLRGNVSPPLLNDGTSLQKPGGAAGGSLHPSSYSPSVPPTAAGLRGQSPGLLLDAPNAPATRNTSREVVAAATAAATGFGDVGLEDETVQVSATATAPSYKTLDLCAKRPLSVVQRTPLNQAVDGSPIAGLGCSSQPAPHPQLQHSSAAATVAVDLQRHAGGEEEDEEGAQAGGESTYQGRSRASSIIKSLRTKTICGHGAASVAAKSGAAADGAGESREGRTSRRSSSSRRSTLSSLASGLSRISSIFKRRLRRPTHGSVGGETPQVHQPTLRQQVNSSTIAAVAAAAHGLTAGKAIETADIRVDLPSAGVHVAPQQQQQQQPPPAATPAAVPETAVKPQLVSVPRGITNSSCDASAEFRAYQGEDAKCGSGVEAATSFIPPAATAVHAAPVEGASSGAGEKKGRRKEDDAERLHRRRRRHRCRDAKDHAGTSSSLAGGVSDRHNRCSCDSSADDDYASSSDMPSASALCTKRSRPRHKGGERRRRQQWWKVADGTSNSRLMSSPPPELQPSDGSASGDGQPNHSSSRQRCEDNRRELSAGVTAASETKAHPTLYLHAPRAFHRSCEGARHNSLLHGSPGHSVRDADDSSNRGWSISRDGALQQPPTPSAAVLAARRREIRAKSRFMSSVNHFAISWHARQVARHQREQQLRRDSQARLAQLQNRNAERKSRSEEAAVAAAVSAAVSRAAPRSRLPARAQLSAVKAHQTGTAGFSLRQLTPSRLQRYEESLARDLIVLDGILEKRRRRELWVEASPKAAAAATMAEAEAEATPSSHPSRPTQSRAITGHAPTAGPLPSRAAAATAAVASTATRMRGSKRNSTCVTPRSSGPTAPAGLNHPIGHGSSNADATDRGAGDDGLACRSRADDRGRGGSSPAPRTPRGAETLSRLIASSFAGVCTPTGLREQLPTAGISHAASSTMTQVQRPNTVYIGDDDDAEASPRRSGATRLSGNAGRIPIIALQRRYEQLLEILASQTASQPPAPTMSNGDDTMSYGQAFMKARSRGVLSRRWHPYPHQHLSREQDEEKLNRQAESPPSKRWRRPAPALACVADVAEAGVARCAAALRAEYYQSQQNQRHREPSKAIDWGLSPAAREAGADTVSMAHLAASYMQARRPSCAGCRPQRLDEYITLALLSMMHGDAGERDCTAADVSSGKMVDVGQGQPRPDTATTLVQRCVREDLYAAPSYGRRLRMSRGKGQQRPTCSGGSTASVPLVASGLVSAGALLSSVQPLQPFTPALATIYGALRARLMRRESRTRRECVSEEQETRYALQRLYIVETILALRVMREAVERQEREVPAQLHEQPLPPQSTLAGHHPFHLGDFAPLSCSSLEGDLHDPAAPALSTSRDIRVVATAPGNSGDGDESGSAVLSDGWVVPSTSVSLSVANSPQSLKSSCGIGCCGSQTPISKDWPHTQRIASGSHSPPPAVAMDADLSDGTREGSFIATGRLLCLASVEATPSSSAQRGGHCSRSPPPTTRRGSDANVGGGRGTAVATVSVPLEPCEQFAGSLAAILQRAATSPESTFASLAEEAVRRPLSAATSAKTTALTDAAGGEKDAGGGVDVGAAVAAPSSPVPSFEVGTEEAGKDGESNTAHTRKAIRVEYDGGSRGPDAAAAAAWLPMCNLATRPLAEEASETPKRVEAHAGELGTPKISPLSSLPAVPVQPPPQSAVAIDDGGDFEQGTRRRADADVAESSSTSSSSSELSSRVKGASHGEGAPQSPDTVADDAENGYYPAVASRSSAAAEARALSIDRGEHIADSSFYSEAECVLNGAAGTMADAPKSSAARSPPCTAKHTNSTPRRSPPPAPPSSSASSLTPSSLSLEAHDTEDVEAAASTALVPQDTGVSRGKSKEGQQERAKAAESEGAVKAGHDSGDAGAENVETMAHGTLQNPVTPADATTRTAIASAAASEPTPESEGPLSAEEGLRQAPGVPPPSRGEQERIPTPTTSTAASASRRQVRFTLPTEVGSGSDGHDDEVIDAPKQKREQRRESSSVTSGLPSMPPRGLEDAAAMAAEGGESVMSSTGVAAVDLWEKLNALDALLLSSFPNYFTTGTEEDGLPGVVMRRCGRPPLVSPPPQQPSASAEEGREGTPSDVYAASLGDHLTPPRLPPESLASQLRRKYGLSQPQQRRCASATVVASRKAFTGASLTDTSRVMTAVPIHAGALGRASMNSPPQADAAVSSIHHSFCDEPPKQSTCTPLASNSHIFTREESSMSPSALSVEPLDEASELQCRHDRPAKVTLGLPATTPSEAAVTSASPSASVSGTWPLSAPATERPSPREGINAAQPEMRRSAWL